MQDCGLGWAADPFSLQAPQFAAVAFQTDAHLREKALSWGGAPKLTTGLPPEAFLAIYQSCEPETADVLEIMSLFWPKRTTLKSVYFYHFVENNLTLLILFC